MEKATEKYISTISYLSKLYDYCNLKLFNSELVRPVITVQYDERNKTRGWWSVKKVWKENDNDEGEHELNMTAQELNRPITDIAATMIHEMCHQYASCHSIKDTSRSGVYHNKSYKNIVEAHGLIVEFCKTFGWSKTKLTSETAALIAEFVNDNPDSIIYRLPAVKNGVKVSSTRKYICPACGNSVRATKELRIMCVDCNELMRSEL